VSERSLGKRSGAPVGPTPKAHSGLPDGTLAPTLRNRGPRRAGRVYALGLPGVKKEIPV
jgi:hypothetical protein